jgi:lysophospholipase L1-like esterase
MDPDLPHRFQELSKATREVAQRRGVPYVDAARVAHPGGDGIHLSTDSHARLGELLADTILTELSSRPTV